MKTGGSTLVAANGTRSTLEASALRGSISGLKLSASLAVDGRRIRCGTSGGLIYDSSYAMPLRYRHWTWIGH